MKRFLLPLGLFLILLVFLAIGLNRDPHEVPSPLVGKPAPDFRLLALSDTLSGTATDTSTDIAADTKHISPADFRGQIWLLNVWASWCSSCQQEHPVLMAFADQARIPVIGLNYKELRGDGSIDMKPLSARQEEALVRQRANAWLAQKGNPYRATALDMDGRVGIDYGVYGVPESYLIDKAGVIRYKQIGPLTQEVLEQTIQPLIAQLELDN